MEWSVLGPQVIGRVTGHPESFLVSHAYLSIWIVDPDSLGREDESAWDSTGGRAIQVPQAVLRRLYSTAPWCHWQVTKSVKMQDFAELSRAGPLLGLLPRNRSCFTRQVGKRLFQAWNI